MAIRFLWNNLADSATVTASSSAADHPVSNIANRWPGRTWHSTGVAAEWVKFDLGSPQNIKALVIYNHNFQLGATIKIQANSLDDWAPPAIDITLTVTADKITYYWSANQTYQWWRISIVDAGNPDGYVEIGRVYLGTYTGPTQIYTSYSEDDVDPSEIAYATGGQISVDEKPAYKEFGLEWTYLLAADKVIMQTVFAAVGCKNPYFVTLDSATYTTETYYVQNMNAWSYQFDPHINAHTLSIRLQEMR